MHSDRAESVLKQEVIEMIADALYGLRYGSVQIIVQDSKVIQIDKTEKYRPHSDRNDKVS